MDDGWDVRFQKGVKSMKKMNLKNFFMKKNEHYEYPNIRFHVSETCVLLLEEIKGEITPF